MRNINWRLVFFAVAAIALGPTIPGVVAGQSNTPSSKAVAGAIDYLFDRAHLAAITSPAVLRYRFERRAQQGESFTDIIEVKIDEVRDGGRRDTSFEFFTGSRRRPYPALPNFLGNPLVIVFLQRDVWALSRTRGGQARYFRYRIRQALRETAIVEEKTIDTDHGPIQVQAITITPYKDDRYRTKLAEFEFKTYEFVVSRQVPGEIYMIRTRVPSAGAKDPGAEPLIEETVVFQDQRRHQDGAPVQ